MKFPVMEISYKHLMKILVMSQTFSSSSLNDNYLTTLHYHVTSL